MFPIIAFVLFSIAIDRFFSDDEPPAPKTDETKAKPESKKPKIEAKPEPAKS